LRGKRRLKCLKKSPNSKFGELEARLRVTRGGKTNAGTRTKTVRRPQEKMEGVRGRVIMIFCRPKPPLLG